MAAAADLNDDLGGAGSYAVVSQWGVYEVSMAGHVRVDAGTCEVAGAGGRGAGGGGEGAGAAKGFGAAAGAAKGLLAKGLFAADGVAKGLLMVEANGLAVLAPAPAPTAAAEGPPKMRLPR